jgi:hypothetical protein
MSDYSSIQEVGGTELAASYPDRGLLPESNWYKAILTVEKEATRWWHRLQSVERFIAVLSADADGLRILVSLDQFAIFIPWSDVSVSAERSTPATVVHLQTAAVPSVSLELHLDDTAADDLFRRVIEPLPQRDPPGRLFWLKPGAVAVFVVVFVAVGVVLGLLELSWVTLLVATVVASTAIWLLLAVCKPFIEEEA